MSLRAAVSKRSSLRLAISVAIISPLGADREGDSVNGADDLGIAAKSAISARPPRRAAFRFKSKLFFYRPFNGFCRSIAAMSLAEKVSRDAGAWFVEADHVSVTAMARRRSRARMDEERAKSGRVVIVSSLFLVIFTGALLIGGHAAIDPLLQSAVDAREIKSAGDVVVTMPDRIYCRHMSFDNVTAEITEGGIERCANDIAGNRPHTGGGFSWGAH
jgi:hypothetical protein